MGGEAAGQRALRRRMRSPALAVVVLAPFLGETFSTASSPLQLLWPPSWPLLVGMYGGGVLICREVARRWGFGWSGLALLGVAYACYEEGLIDRFWWDPAFWREAGVGDYSEVGGLNVLLAVHLTLFHVAVTVLGSIMIVDWLFPEQRDRPWVGRPGLLLAGVALVVVVPLASLQFREPTVGSLLFAAAVMLAAVAAAFLLPRVPVPTSSTVPTSDTVPSADTVPPVRTDPRRRRGLGWIAFLAAAAHFLLTYSVPHLGLPWPVGLGVALAPVAIGFAVIRPRGPAGLDGADGRRVFCGIAAFFLLLDVAVGLAGRYDLSLGAVLAAGGLLWLVRSTRASENRG